MASTLKDIADRAGMSIRSVRRSLAGEPGVSDETRKSVNEIAAQLGYVPNIAARNLRMRHNSFVGIVRAANPAEVYRRRETDLIRRLGEAGYHPLIGVMPRTAAELDELTRHWAGVVDHWVWQSPPSPEVAAKIPSLTGKSIMVDAEPVGPRCAGLAIDRGAGIVEAVNALLKSGRKHIIRCGRRGNQRDGFDLALAGSNVKHGFLAVSDCEFENGYAAAPEILASGADAVFFDVDRMAFGFLRYAWEKKIEIPRRIAVVGFDDEPFGRYSTPTLSSVAQPINDLNAAVLSLLEKGFEQDVRLRFPTTFVPRESSGNGVNK